MNRTALAGLLREIGPAALAGLVGAVVLLGLFAKLSEEVFSNEITSLDNNSSLWVHSFATAPLDAFFNAVSNAGGPVGVVALTIASFALLLWHKHRRDAWRLVIVVVGGAILNQVLKLLFHRSRPDLWPAAHVVGFSFPSGHATLAFCLFGMFIWLGWRHFTSTPARVGWAALLSLLILLVGLSRIYLGAHFLSDVVAGYLSAGVWLASVLSGSQILYQIRGQGTNRQAPSR